MPKNQQAQTFLAYVVITAVLVAALIAMRSYFVRSVQEKFRQAGDAIGGGDQYEPGVTK
jgi:Flp pilus assembly pilin Flp